MVDASKVMLDAVLRCPFCLGEELLRMPENFCEILRPCRFCRRIIRPRPGDCCVYCSFATVPCPPHQQESQRKKQN